MNKSPSEVLAQMAESKGLKVSSEKFASYLDQHDELSHFREFFHHPDCKFSLRTWCMKKPFGFLTI